MKNLYLIVVFLLITISLHAQQEPFDCINAVEVCGGESTTFVYESAKGNINEVIPESCFDGGIGSVDWTKNSLWLKYKFKKEGKFSFTIHPLPDKQDIDFILLQSQNNNCTDFSISRCMTSGDALFKKDSPCLGDTGLRESSMDYSEGPGCHDNYDNFVSSVDVKENDVYYLMITNYASTKLNFTISYDHPDLLDCIVATENIPNVTIEISPNPTTNYLKVSSRSNQIIKYQILDSTGKVVKSSSFKQNKIIDTSKLNGGLYFMRFITSSSSISTKKILILR